MTDKAKILKTAAFNMGKKNVNGESRKVVDISAKFAMLGINDFSNGGITA